MKAIEHTNNGKRFLLVEVPDRAKGFKVVSGIGLRYSYESGCMEGLVIPPGEWQLIGKAEQLSEAECASICSPWGNGYEGYPDFSSHDEWALFAPCLTATDSLHSLLASNNLQPSTTIILQSK